MPLPKRKGWQSLLFRIPTRNPCPFPSFRVPSSLRPKPAPLRTAGRAVCRACSLPHLSRGCARGPMEGSTVLDSAPQCSIDGTVSKTCPVGIVEVSILYLGGSIYTPCWAMALRPLNQHLGPRWTGAAGDLKPGGGSPLKAKASSSRTAVFSGFGRKMSGNPVCLVVFAGLCMIQA